MDLHPDVAGADGTEAPVTRCQVRARAPLGIGNVVPQRGQRVGRAAELRLGLQVLAAVGTGE